MRSIALANQKGGVGKTTSTANLGASLALMGRRVLLVDIDPQANLTTHFGLSVAEDQPSVYDVLMDSTPPEKAVMPTATAGLDLIPSEINLAGAEVELVGVVGRETALRGAMRAFMAGYDYVLFDCPPSLGLLTLNAMTTVKEIFIPIQTEFFALQGMSKLMSTVELVRKRLNPELRVAGIIACQYDSRTNLSAEVLANIKEFFPGKLFKTVVHRNVKLAESPSHGEPIAVYARASRGNEDYMALAREVEGVPEPAAQTPPPAAEPRFSAEAAQPRQDEAPCAAHAGAEETKAEAAPSAGTQGA